MDSLIDRWNNYERNINWLVDSKHEETNRTILFANFIMNPKKKQKAQFSEEIYRKNIKRLLKGK